SVIADSQSAAVMASATDGKKQIMFSGKVYGVNYIRHVCATRDQARLLVDHRIVDFASIIVIRIVRLDHAASQLCLQLNDGILFECFLHGKANKGRASAIRGDITTRA